MTNLSLIRRLGRGRIPIQLIFLKNYNWIINLNYLTPSTLVLAVQTEAHPAVVGHLLAPVDQHVDVVRVVQGLALAPDHGEGGRHVGRPAGVRELHLVAVDGVAQQLSVHTCHTALDVELTNKPRKTMYHHIAFTKTKWWNAFHVI